MGGGGGLVGGGGQGRCERRIGSFCENSQKMGGVGGGGGGGVGEIRVDVIEELKFLGKFTKKKFRGGVGLRGGVGSGWGGGGGGGQGGCDRRIEVSRKIQKKLGGGGGRVGGIRVDVKEELKFL